MIRDHSLRTPPVFCAYADGPCDQDFKALPDSHAVFLYPSDPASIAGTVEGAVRTLRALDRDHVFTPWKDFRIAGQNIFCTICKQCRAASTVIVDTTTLNFNLMFEIGFSIGLGLPVIPIRDTTFIKDKLAFERVGMLDTLGYVDFQNSSGLAESLLTRFPAEPLSAPLVAPNRQSPLYIVKSSIKTEGEVRLMSAVKRSSLNFKAYDPVEVPRLTLHEARRSVLTSYAVIGHLLSPYRDGAAVQNARCALIAGLAVAAGKLVLLLQEGEFSQPIDYRDIVTPYAAPDDIPRLIEPTILSAISRIQEINPTIVLPERLLERLNIGDVAAENEIGQLRSYFVRTGQFQEAKRGSARLIVGRKGSGKTAIFLALRAAFGQSKSHLVLDLKPEGHQFTKLREAVLDKLTPGMQEHTLAAFWHYILLCEIAQKASDTDHSWAQRDDARRSAFEELMAEYRRVGPFDAGDMSERLLRQVDRLTTEANAPGIDFGGQVTEQLFRGDIKSLNEAVGGYLAHKEQVWVLIDNLDKGWPTRGSTDADILIIRTLLEATRKLQRELASRGVEFHSLVFLRNDIFEHLVRQTPDKGKDTAIALDWDDPEVFKEIVRQRIATATGLQGSFDDLWGYVFDQFIGTQPSFDYIVERTLMRPRDLLIFIHRAIEVAINRGHDRVSKDDLLKAEESYSEDMLLALTFELRDISQDFAEVFYQFLGCPVSMPESDVIRYLEGGGLLSAEARNVVKLLLWFGFLGVQQSTQLQPEFSYQNRYNISKLLAPIEKGVARFVIHPAFWSALNCVHMFGQQGLPMS